MKQSIAGYIRQHLEEIEQKIHIGIRHESIVEEIKNSGVDIDLAKFRTYLYRARKSLRSAETPPTPTHQAKTSNQPQEKKPKPQEKENKPASFNFDGSNTYTKDQLY